jgi:Flp pilus assembly protein protease CpaA
MVILCPAAIAAAVFDWRSRRIPNALVVAIALGGFAAVALTLGSSRLPLPVRRSTFFVVSGRAT